MENKKQYTELKKRALLAKQRMRMGYWQKMMDERERAISSGANAQSVQMIRDIQLAQIERDQNRTLGTISSAARDEEIYRKVVEMLSSDEDVLNPIGRLVEREVYEKLDEANKQKYILELSKKYREMEERYRRERSNKLTSIL